MMKGTEVSRNESIISVTERKVPTVIGLSLDSELVIGESAKELGLKGRTNTFQFKPDLGEIQDDARYVSKMDSLGRGRKGIPKPYWVSSGDKKVIETFTPLEATTVFLEKLLPNKEAGISEIIIGEPILDEKWKENYRKNIRTVLGRIGFGDPIFFPEPFAVFQYYRYVERLIQNTGARQTILVIDFGGGTFDCCVIRTRKTGELSRSGANSLPLGVQSQLIAGRDVDIELLEIAKTLAKRNGILFKDDPVKRACQSAKGLWIVETLKIRLSEAIEKIDEVDEKKLINLKETMRLPSGTFHMDEDVEVTLTGKDLKEVVTRLWHRTWGKTIIDCHKESQEKLGGEIDHYDYVLFAGGSAQLPFLGDLVRKTLTNQLRGTNIVFGNYVGAAVAKGIAAECREQSDKRPSLVNDRLVSCFLNDLYIRVGRKKNEALKPKIKESNSVKQNNEGLIYNSPGVLEDSTIKCKIEMQYKPNGAFHFWFHKSLQDGDSPLNALSSIKIPGNGSVDKKINLELEIEADGTVTPFFTFRKNGRDSQRVGGHPFNLGSHKEGKLLLGVDFGTCNSYVAKYIAPARERGQASYPEYKVSEEIQTRLRKIEQQCHDFQSKGYLKKEILINHANENEFDFVFHSNKIEGNKLTRGETIGTLKAAIPQDMSKDQKEAVNLRKAYRWMLENYEVCTDQFPAFVRELNKQLLSDIEINAGKYRTEEVSIAGVSYIPPPWGSVEEFMMNLTSEIRKSKTETTSGLELAIRVHTKFVAIHPFVDGNGRTARLLIAALLLSYDLPVLILNADDKERYLTALGFSNDGSLDALLILFIEILEQTLEEFTAGHKEHDVAIQTEDRKSSLSQSDSGLKKVETKINGDTRERLLSILKQKGQKRAEVQKATYPAWKNAFEMFLNELSDYVQELDNMGDFRNAGFEIKFQKFDMVTEDTFDAYWTRREVSYTWLCAITIQSLFETDSIMFQFGRCSDKLRGIEPLTAPVTCHLAMGGGNAGLWLPMQDEPIKLREIGYVDGRLIYMDYDNSLVVGGISDILNDLIADLMEA